MSEVYELLNTTIGFIDVREWTIIRMINIGRYLYLENSCAKLEEKSFDSAETQFSLQTGYETTFLRNWIYQFLLVSFGLEGYDRVGMKPDMAVSYKYFVRVVVPGDFSYTMLRLTLLSMDIWERVTLDTKIHTPMIYVLG